MSGFVATLAGVPIAWKSKRQSVIAGSSAEAEYVAAGVAAREVEYLRRLLEEMGLPQDGPTPFYMDSESAARIIAKDMPSPSVKHLAIRWHIARDLRERGVIEVRKVNTLLNKADGFTKALAQDDHARIFNLVYGRRVFRGRERVSWGTVSVFGSDKTFDL